MNNITALMILALVCLVSFYLSLLPSIDKTKKIKTLILLIRAIVTFVFLVGLTLGWYISSSFFISVVVPSALYFAFLSTTEWLIRKIKSS